MLADQKDEHKTQEERDMEKYAVIEDAKQYMDEYREDMIVFAQKLLKVKSISGHEKGIAVVQLSASVDDTVLKKTVEEEGYEVTGIR